MEEELEKYLCPKCKGKSGDSWKDEKAVHIIICTFCCGKKYLNWIEYIFGGDEMIIDDSIKKMSKEIGAHEHILLGKRKE